MSEEQLDLFARGELPATESRELAQKSLDDPDLFEDLTCASLARTALAKPGRRRPAWAPFAGVAVAAAAAVVIVLLSTNVLYRPSPEAGARAFSTGTTAAAPPGPPVFLARAGDANPTVFRGEDAQGRMPRQKGAVTSIADGMVTIDLGALDGLARDAEVEVLRDGKVLGRIRLATVFRERARADLPSGLALRVNDEVRVPAPMYARAALDEIAALSARGDSGGARRLAGQAAASDIIGIAATGDIAATSYEDLNNLGGIAELRGDRVKAQSLYEQALRAGPPSDARKAVEANLARVRAGK